MNPIYYSPKVLLGIGASAAFVVFMVSPAALAQIGQPPPTDCNDYQRNIVRGTGDAEDLEGTEGRDVILGRGGDDTMDGAGCNDILLGGSGDDEISGGDDSDKVLGQGGDDTLTGGSGRDILVCGSGEDTVTDFNPYEGDIQAGCENV
jgi:Ca2+-binding RTX toxin-like protein